MQRNDFEGALAAARSLIDSAAVYYRGSIVGAVAARDPNMPALNYADCFIRDFVPTGFIHLLEGRPEIVRDFLAVTQTLHAEQKCLEGHELLPRIMPASFKVVQRPSGDQELHADFGDRAIGRVAPVDSMMWWILLLQSYVKVTDDWAFVDQPEVQQVLCTLVDICLQDRFEVFPTLLVPDGSFMIDRRMGVYGHPLEIQALFYGTLEAIQRLLRPVPANQELLNLAARRQELLADYVRAYYWLDLEQLNAIHRYPTEVFGEDSENALNIYPESIPEWLLDWLPEEAGYLLGNLGPGRMDFRFFSFGNLLAIIYGLVRPHQASGILDTVTLRWPDLAGMMPLKLIYPAMEGIEWQFLTGSDPKNRPWSYHNGGSWPMLLWGLAAAAVPQGRSELVERALETALPRLHRDHWPEYYDGRSGRLVGRRAVRWQTWSAAAVVLADRFLREPEDLRRLGLGAPPERRAER